MECAVGHLNLKFMIQIEKLAGLQPANFLAPAVSWWPFGPSG